MTNNESFHLIEKSYNLNKPQILFANYILKKLNEDYSSYHFIEEYSIKNAIEEQFDCELTSDDIIYTLDKLEYEFYFIDQHIEGQRYKITHNGREILQKYEELILFFANEIKANYESALENLKEKSLKQQIDNLTLKQLKGNIFQVNKWWLILLINAGITILVSVFVALLIKKMGIN